MPQATTAAGRRRSPSEQSLGAIQGGLSVIAQSVNQARSHERLLREAGVRLDRAGASLLYKLHLNGGVPMRVTALAERLGVDTPTVTRKVQQLERVGLVSRDADPDDRRAFRIALTKDGRVALDRLLAAKRRWLEQLLEGWTASEVDTFAELLGRFTSSLQTALDGDRVD